MYLFILTQMTSDHLESPYLDMDLNCSMYKHFYTFTFCFISSLTFTFGKWGIFNYYILHNILYVTQLIQYVI